MGRKDGVKIVFTGGGVVNNGRSGYRPCERFGLSVDEYIACNTAIAGKRAPTNH